MRPKGRIDLQFLANITVTYIDIEKIVKKKAVALRGGVDGKLLGGNQKIIP